MKRKRSEQGLFTVPNFAKPLSKDANTAAVIAEHHTNDLRQGFNRM